MTAPGPVTVAALQYCAAGTSQETLAFLLPMIAEAAEQGAGLVSLPEAATFLAGSRRALERKPRTKGKALPLMRCAVVPPGMASIFTPGRCSCAAVMAGWSTGP